MVVFALLLKKIVDSGIGKLEKRAFEITFLSTKSTKNVNFAIVKISNFEQWI